jgi:hypothetical protein
MNQTSRCPRCKSDVPVPEAFASGDTLPCDICQSQLRVLRNDKGAMRLVIADAGPVREQLTFNKTHVDRLQRELQDARHSIGIGANGFAISVLYLVSRLALEEREMEMGLLVEAIVLGVVVGIGLEAANYLFLAKRKAITRITGEIDQMKEEQKLLQGLVREAERAQQQLASASDSGSARRAG